MPEVAVVGAGITGLVTALELADHGVDVLVVEAGERVGGKLWTRPFAGRSVDVGADAWLDRDGAVARLTTRLGIEEHVVEAAESQVWLWIDGRLRPLPAGTVMGVPTDVRALIGVLGIAGSLRAAAEPLVPRGSMTEDPSVAEVIGRHFGRAVVDRMVEPLLGGVYAGSADRLSLTSVAPPLAAAWQEGGSLARVVHRQRSQAPGKGPRFRTLRTGLSSLAEACARQLGDRVRTHIVVDAVARAGDGLVLATDTGPIQADRVVLATPASVTADLVAELAPGVAAELRAVAYASVGVVTLAYDADLAGALPRGSGMLVPRSERRLIKASTWLTSKWGLPVGPAPLLIRASVGRVDDTSWDSLNDDELATRVDAEIREATGLPKPAVERLVTRWPQALPQYDVGHTARVERIRRDLMDLGATIHVAGAAFDGVGIAGCVHGGVAAAHHMRVA